MNKITKFMKENVKVLAAVAITAAVSGGSVYAATILMNANQVGFDKTGTSLSSTDVQGALDELYQKTKNLYPMQGFDKSILSTTGDSAKVYDKRDGNIYTVRKLEDGNIWMTENLRIANKTITSADSNVTSDFTIPASSDYYDFANADANYDYVIVDSTYGGYYTFYTATAGTGGTSLTSGNAPSSICPKGWRLPTGGSSGEFKTLYDDYDSVALMMSEPNFTLSGYIYYSTFPIPDPVRDQGSYGNFWASTVVDADYANDLYLYKSSVAPNRRDNKSNGNSVRCVAQ